MRTAHRFGILMTLALGVAAAQNAASDGTRAGTAIENRATAFFNDPLAGDEQLTSADSNVVVTTVAARPGFDLVYRDSSDGLMNGTQAPGNTPQTASVTATLIAGVPLETPYLAVNNGNTEQTIVLSSAAGSLSPTVAYYADPDGDGQLSSSERLAGPITSLRLPYDDPATTTDEGVVAFVQVLTTPASASVGAVYAASPVGSGEGFDVASSRATPQTESATLLGLQFAAVTIAPQPPVPADVTGNTLTNNLGPTSLKPLVATDDRAVVSYTVVTLPDPASGVLLYGGAPVTAGQTITDPAGLSFDPAAGFSGNATFDYRATDNDGAASTTNRNADGSVTPGPATYTIPVQAPQTADLTVVKSNNWTSTPTQVIVSPDASSDIVAAGTYSRYYIRVTNVGTTTVTGAVLRDLPNAGLDSSNLYIGCNDQTPGTCTATNRPTNVQLLSGYALPTLAPGQFYDIRITPKVTSNAPTADNTATVTLPGNMVDLTPENNTSTDSDRIGVPPVAATATNAPLTNDMGATRLSPSLSGSDSDGQVVGYRIEGLPGGGVLALDGVPVKVGQVIPSADIGRLTFDPDPLTGAGGTSNLSFQYRSLDNDGLQSGLASYTIPVSRVLGALPCQNTVYGLFGTVSALGDSNMTSIRPVAPDGTLGPAIAVPPYAKTAALAVSPDGSRVFTMGDDYVLRMYDALAGVWSTLGKITDSSTTVNPVRMTIDKTGTGYVSVSNLIWTFDGMTGGNLSTAKTIVFSEDTGLTPAPYLYDPNMSLNGDFISGSDGNLYLMANPSGSNFLDLFRIQGTKTGSPVASYAGRLAAANIGSANYAGFAAIPDGEDIGIGSDIYAISTGGRFIQVDMTNLTVTPVRQATELVSSDLGSCFYPTLRPAMSSQKTVSNVTVPGATSSKPGDTLEYTITVSNSGTIAASGVTLQDALPPGTRYVPGSTTTNGSATPDAAAGTFPYATTRQIRSSGTDVANGLVLVGNDKPVVVRFRVEVTPEAGNLIRNQGDVGFINNQTGTAVRDGLKTDDPRVGGASDPTDFPVVRAAPALSVTKTVDSRYVRVTPSTTDDTVTQSAEQLTYTLTLTNNGSAEASGVTLTDQLPSGLTYVSSTATPALSAEPAQSGQTLTFNVGQLAAGATQTIQVKTALQVTPNVNQQPISNQVVARANGLNPVASAPAVTDVVYPKLRKSVRNLTRASDAGQQAQGLPGELLEYCLDFSNYGTLPLANYRLTDHVPASTTVVGNAYDSGSSTGLGIKLTRGGETSLLSSAADSDAGSLSSAGGTSGQGTLSANIGTLNAGETGSLCFQVRIR
ncbi:MAG: hypothetical protein Q4C89_08160 [Deinococcus sp.]|uniref:hypothetical protein n=1 Tax=Deinococcus sp. TaxID=47478 RepID=UPI0026DC9A49|nr:hypothetical protein [Deinococcus sp.]MDO4245980.1 hypothetical protein [Deinococcus sp.]